MKIDFNAKITDLRGRALAENGTVYDADKAFADGKPVEGQAELTLGFVCTAALNSGLLEEKSFAKSNERYMLMKKIYGSDAAAGPQDVTAKEVSLIQDQLPKVWLPLIVGRAGELLEPKEEAKPKADTKPVAKAA